MRINISILKKNLILKIYIRISNLTFDFENCYFNCLKHYLNYTLIFFESRNYYFNSENYYRLKMGILILNILIVYFNSKKNSFKF